MSPLHPTLKPGPTAKPICLGCGATNDTAVLAPIPNSTTVFLCVPCAGVLWIDVNLELHRRMTAAFHNAIAPEVAAA